MPRVWQEHDVDTIFRRAHRFVDGNELNTIGAFPVLKYKPDLTFDLIFVKNTAGIITTFPGIGQHDAAMLDLHIRLGGTDFIHDGEKFETAFPIHEFSGTNAAAILLRPEAVEVRKVGKGEINFHLPPNFPIPVAINRWDEMVQSLMGVDTYAVKNGFAGGFIDCHFHHDYHRLFLLKEDFFTRKSIPEWRLNHLTRFEYHFSKPEREAPVRKAHNRICSIIDSNSCSVLTERDKQMLKQIYNDRIFYHYEGVENPRSKAEAAIYGSGMWFRPDFLDTNIHDALTQTVFHEMMHNIGYCHPRDPEDPSYPDSIPEKVKLCVPSTDLIGLFPFECNILRSSGEDCP
ncbi:hypothetical protein V7127_23335 [Bacillus sp. JJ1773]|uniref:hypothetical protein n=1 Tax=Bacillus sp. JJ1773 TaxID=3122965 RepID=UPI002FFF5A74